MHARLFAQRYVGTHLTVADHNGMEIGMPEPPVGLYFGLLSVSVVLFGFVRLIISYANLAAGAMPLHPFRSVMVAKKISSN